ncbi:MAG: hypothetical protein LBL21_02655 [Rickettsiales bacterium]|jgi:hypothetical protein|nr:hypothetical protein [Rickettsiales bacterium]
MWMADLEKLKRDVRLWGREIKITVRKGFPFGDKEIYVYKYRDVCIKVTYIKDQEGSCIKQRIEGKKGGEKLTTRNAQDIHDWLVTARRTYNEANHKLTPDLDYERVVAVVEAVNEIKGKRCIEMLEKEFEKQTVLRDQLLAKRSERTA